MNDTTRIDGDFSGLFDEIDEAIQKWKKLEKTEVILRKNTSDLIRVQEDLVKGIKKHTIELAKGVKAVITINKKTKKYGVIIDDTRAKIEKQRKAEEALRKEQSNRNRSAVSSVQSVTGRPKFAKSGASKKEIYDYKNEEGKLRELFIKHKYTTGKLKTLWENVEKGKVKSAVGAERIIQAQVKKTLDAQQNLGKHVRKEQEKTDKHRHQNILKSQKLEESLKSKQSKKEEEVHTKKKYEKEGKIIGKKLHAETGTKYQLADRNKQQEYQNAISSLKRIMVAEKISADKIERIYNDLKENKVRAYTGWQQQAQRSLNRVMNAERRLARVNSETARSFHVSWRSVVRLTAVQLFHQGISQAVGSLRDGLTDAIELSKKIGEIRTISQDMQLPYNEWMGQIRKVSDKWGTDLQSEIESVYQTISNQVAKGEEAIRFSETASKFSVVTTATPDAGIGLITSALNAFGKDASEADNVAASFFKTIELGRVRAAEMANAYGNIAIMAHRLNVEMPELNAAISTLTYQGVKYNQVATQLRGIFAKLIKPTKAMKGFLADIGATSGEEAIKIYGLGQFLFFLQQRTQGSSTELAKLITRMRGLTGAMGMTNAGLQTYLKNQKRITDGAKDFDNAAKIMMKNPGKLLDIELNKIKNFFKVDMSNEILLTLADWTRGFGGLAAVVKTFVTVALSGMLVAGVTYAIVTLKKLSTMMRAAALLMRGFFISSPILAMSLGVSVALVALVKYFSATNKSAKSLNAEIVKSVKSWESSFDKIDSAHQKYIETTKKGLDDTSKAESKYFAQRNSVSAKFYNAEQQRQGDLYKRTNDLLEKTKEYNSILAEASQQSFEWDLEDKTDTEKIQAYQVEIAKLQEQQEKAAASGDVETFNRTSSRIKSLMVTLRNLSKESEGSLQSFGATDRHEANYRQQIKDEILLRELLYKTKEKQVDLSTENAREDFKKGVDVDIEEGNINSINEKFRAQQRLAQSRIDSQLKNNAGVLKELELKKIIQDLEERRKISVKESNRIQKQKIVNAELEAGAMKKQQIVEKYATKVKDLQTTAKLAKTVGDTLAEDPGMYLKTHRTDEKGDKFATVIPEDFQDQSVEINQFAEALRNLGGGEDADKYARIVNKTLSDYISHFKESEDPAILEFQQQVVDLKKSITNQRPTGYQQLADDIKTNKLLIDNLKASEQKRIKALPKIDLGLPEFDESEILKRKTTKDLYNEITSHIKDANVAQDSLNDSMDHKVPLLPKLDSNLTSMLEPDLDTTGYYSQLLSRDKGWQLPEQVKPAEEVRSIGEINIYPQATGNTQMDVVRVGKLLQREIRRGTIAV